MQKSTGKRLRLTESSAAALPVDGTDYLVSDELTSGFRMRVTPAGAKLFLAHASVNGRVRKVTIGAWPDKTVAQARHDARAILEDLRAGRDPVVEKAVRRKAVEAGETTVGALADRWMAEYVRLKLKPRTAADYESLLSQHVKPKLGHLTVGRISKDDVIKFHAGLAKTPRRANYTVAVLRSLMTFAEDCGLRPPASNPAKKIKPYPEKAHERFLSEDEIGRAAEAIGKAERDGKIGPHAAAGLRLALLTGARSGEVTAIEWSHIDIDRKIIRLPDSKTNSPRTIYLSDAALEIVKTVPRVGKFMIAGELPDEPLKNLRRCWDVARSFAGLKDVRLHDLRHSYASLAAGKGVSLPIIGKMLGHKTPQTTQRYAHLARDVVSQVNDEIGAAMTAAIDRKRPESAKIIKIRRARKVGDANG